MNGLLSRLAAIVGERNVLTDEASVTPYVNDWLGKYHGSAQAVVRPGSAAEVAAVLALCRETGTPIVPQGGNTSMSGGATPDATGVAVVLSLTRMNRIREIDPIGNTITVDAGVVLAHVHAAAKEINRHFPLSLGAEGSCTIGGNLATNAGGVAVLRYGTMRELTLGLEVALPDGRIWDGLTALRKDNTGYALRDLFIGSEGTLGVITGAVLKLFPEPKARATALVAVQNAEAALSLLAAVRDKCGDRLTAFEFMTDACIDLVLRHVADARIPFGAVPPALVLVELSDTDDDAALNARLEDALVAASEAELALDAAIAQDIAQARIFWRLREGISEALVREGKAAKHDISVPVARMAQFIAAADRAVAAVSPGVRHVVFGHLGDGNLHYNLLRATDMSEADFAVLAPRLTRVVHDEAKACRGSISAEHGIGQLRVDDMPRYKAAIELELMAALKGLFDPAELLNPGKLLPPQQNSKERHFMALLDESAKGVYVIAVTPFADDGALDLESTDRMVDFYLGKGATGLTVLGMMGEAPKLTAAESNTFVKRVLARVGGRVPVVVGVSAPGFAPMRELSESVMAQGAAGVMVAPPGNLRTDDQIYTYYEAVAETLGDTPFVLQDFPLVTNVQISPATILRIVKALPTCVMLKHEDWPGLSKISALRAASEKGERRISILVGNGGMFLPEELGRGADGAMTGFAYPEMMVDVGKAYVAGDVERAHDLFDAYLPLARYEQQPGLGLTIRKYTLAKRGAIASGALRKPGPKLSSSDIADIERLIARQTRRLAEIG